MSGSADHSGCLTNSWAPVVIDEGDNSQVYISASEHYEVLDPSAPGPEREYRTTHFALRVCREMRSGDAEIVEAVLSRDDWLELAQRALTAGRHPRHGEIASRSGR